MSRTLRTLSALLLGAALVASAPALAADPTPSPDGKVTLSFRGPLRDALQAIAKQSGLNVVATGPLDTEVELHLQGVPGAQALRTLARAYGLQLEQEGGLWMLRAGGAHAGTHVPHGLPQAAEPPAAAPPAVPPTVADLPEVPRLPRLPAGPRPPRVHDTDDPDDVVVHGRNHTVEADQAAEDVVVYGGNLTVDGHVERDAAVFGGNMTVNGAVEKDAVAVGGNLYINGRVEGDAHAFGGNVELGPDAAVEGDVSAFGGSVKRADGSRVGGTREAFHLPSRRGRTHGTGAAEWLGNLLIQFVLLFGLGFVFLLFAPTRMKQLGEEILAQPVACGLTGLLSAIALVPLSILLIVTLVGIPVFLAVLVLGPVGLVMGVTALANELGTRLPVLRGRKTQAVVLALGTGVLLVLFSLPVLGALFLTAALLVSLGALVRTRFGSRPRGMPEPLRPASVSF